MTTFFSGVAVGLLVAVTVSWSAPIYKRADWVHWRKVPDSCRDVRQVALARDARPSSVVWSDDGCRVVRGVWLDPYTGNVLTDPMELDVDHLVPLSEASKSGGWAWTKEQKEDYANYLSYKYHLRAVRDIQNQAKGDKTPDLWRPPSGNDHCVYGQAWSTVKFLWQLSSTVAERNAVAEMVATC